MFYIAFLSTDIKVRQVLLFQTMMFRGDKDRKKMWKDRIMLERKLGEFSRCYPVIAVRPELIDLDRRASPLSLSLSFSRWPLSLIRGFVSPRIFTSVRYDVGCEILFPG